jgi:hypothetical protein
MPMPMPCGTWVEKILSENLHLATPIALRVGSPPAMSEWLALWVVVREDES